MVFFKVSQVVPLLLLTSNLISSPMILLKHKSDCHFHVVSRRLCGECPLGPLGFFGLEDLGAVGEALEVKIESGGSMRSHFSET